MKVKVCSLTQLRSVHVSFFALLPSWFLWHIRHLYVNICGVLASIFLLNDFLHYEGQTSEDLKSQGELWWALTSVFGDSPFYFEQSLIIYCNTVQNLTCNMIFTIAAHDFLLYEPFCPVVWTFGTPKCNVMDMTEIFTNAHRVSQGFYVYESA